MNARPNRSILARLPYVRDKFFLTRVLPRGTMRIDRHPEFIRFLQELPRTQIGLHGLYHAHKGLNNIVEFQGEGVDDCKDTVLRAMEIFQNAGLNHVLGMCPPAWHLPHGLA